MNLNRNQIIAIVIAILAVLMASTAQLTDLFGPKVAKTIISAAGLINGMLSGVLAVITGQAGMVKDVQDMPGVERIQVNAKANPTLARIALDENVDKVEPLLTDKAQITETAKE